MAMLGRRSSLIGALVQAISIAIHDAVEYKGKMMKSRSMQPTKQENPIQNEMEVIASKQR
jgi:hypothetical protein